MYVQTGIIPFVPFLGTEDSNSNLKPIIYVAGGALLAWGLLSYLKKNKRRKRKGRPVKKLTLKPMSDTRFEVDVDGTLSHHSSEEGAKREAQRFTRRGIPASIKRVR
jgi:hypothetical protein